MSSPTRDKKRLVSQKEIKDKVITKQLTHMIERCFPGLQGCLVEVIGEVAHVRGSVSSQKERLEIGTLLREQGGVYSVWDLLTVGKQELTILDIGCGEKKQVPEAIGLDAIEAPGVDVVADLEKPLPFEDNFADHVFAVNVLEHIHHLLGLFNSLHKVLKKNGILHVLVPNWKNPVAVADPTHVRFFDIQTFKYFCEIHAGVKVWKPLMVSASQDTISADLTPAKEGIVVTPQDIARWFY